LPCLQHHGSTLAHNFAAPPLAQLAFEFFSFIPVTVPSCAMTDDYSK
jgi:hypothetical protein